MSSCIFSGLVQYEARAKQGAAIDLIKRKQGHVRYEPEELDRTWRTWTVRADSKFVDTVWGVSFDFPVPDMEPFNDSDVPYLLDLKGLKTLDLRNTDVTDEGLRELSKIASLECLTLNRLITEDGTASFKKSRSDIVVVGAD